MNLLEATAHLIEIAKTHGPEDAITRKAVRRMEKRLRLLQLRAAKAKRSRRRYAWKSLMHLQKVCECQYTFTFGAFVRTAELNHRGWINAFDCPECGAPVIRLQERADCLDYWVQEMNAKDRPLVGN